MKRKRSYEAAGVRFYPKPYNSIPALTMVLVPMERFTSHSMLNLQPSTYLRFWEWREDKINL